LQCFQESSEGWDGQHMDLIDDEKLVVSLSGRDAHLFVEIADVIHRIMRSRIQFDYIGGILFLKCYAGSTFPACLKITGNIFTVDRFRQYPGGGGFPYAPRSAEQKGVCNFILADGIFERGGNMLLAHHFVEALGAVFSCGYNKLTHMNK